MDSYIARQREVRARAFEEAKALLETAAAEKRDLTAEEQAKYETINAELDERAAVIERLEKDAERERRAAEMRVEAPSARPVSDTPSDAEMFRKLVDGEIRSYTFGERRDLVTNVSGDGPEVVPQGFYAELQQLLKYTGPMLDESVVTVLRTAQGNDIKVPVQTARSAATATAEAATFAETDPQFSTITLRSLKVGGLVQVSRELLTDAGISDPDLVGFLADQFAVAIGTAVNAFLTVGTGTVQPRGIVDAAGSGITGGTGVSGLFTFVNLIDLAHSVDSAYARRPKAGWMMNRATLGKVRGLTGPDSAFIYAVNATGPDTLLGYPVYENPDVVNTATNAKSVIFGDLGAYHTRVVAPGIEIARSDDFAFSADLVTFRAAIRVGGDLGGGRTEAVKYFAGGTA